MARVEERRWEPPDCAPVVRRAVLVGLIVVVEDLPVGLDLRADRREVDPERTRDARLGAVIDEISTSPAVRQWALSADGGRCWLSCGLSENSADCVRTEMACPRPIRAVLRD